MSWRGETEDGIGWGGLVPTKAERDAERVEATQRSKMLAMETALLRIAAFPRTRDEEMSIEGAREIARAALAYCKPANAELTGQQRRGDDDGQ